MKIVNKRRIIDNDLTLKIEMYSTKKISIAIRNKGYNEFLKPIYNVVMNNIYEIVLAHVLERNAI